MYLTGAVLQLWMHQKARLVLNAKFVRFIKKRKQLPVPGNVGQVSDVPTSKVPATAW